MILPSWHSSLGIVVLAMVACSSRPPAKPAAPAPHASSTPADAAVVAPAPAVAHAPEPEHGGGSGSAHATTSSVPLADASCPLKPLPKGCPATPPNVNHPCSPKGIECTYVAGCCPSPVYVCDKHGHFEARFTRCN